MEHQCHRQALVLADSRAMACCTDSVPLAIPAGDGERLDLAGRIRAWARRQMVPPSSCVLQMRGACPLP